MAAISKFSDNYTTDEKKKADNLKPIEEQTGEKDKTQLTNDAFAVGEILDSLNRTIKKLTNKRW